MEANSFVLIQYLAGLAQREADKAGNTTAVQWLQTYGDKIAKGEILLGKTLTSANEAGGSFTFSFSLDCADFTQHFTMSIV